MRVRRDFFALRGAQEVLLRLGHVTEQGPDVPVVAWLRRDPVLPNRRSHVVRLASEDVTGDTDWQLRAARPDDLAELVRLARAFYDEDGFTTSDADLDRNFRALFAIDDRAHIAIAELGNRAIGFALTTAQLVLESGLVAELQDLYVEPENRRGGLGAALIEDAARWARSQHATLLDVVVAPNGQDVEPLLGYYAARGFRDDGRRLISRTL